MFTIRFFASRDIDELIGEEPDRPGLVDAIERAELLVKNSHLAKAPGQKKIVRYVIVDDQGRQVHEQFLERK